MPIIFDIETVADENLWQPPEENPDAFPPVIACRPIVISYVHINGNNTPVRLASIRGEPGKSHDLDGLEPEILRKWADHLIKCRPPLVSWNGRRFDFPVLLQRCFAHGIHHLDPLEKGSYGYRYSTDMHADLMDMLGVYGAARACSLDITARAIGLPGKAFESGSSVGELFAAGEYERICTYCETDAFQTAGAWLRWLLVSGALTMAAYRQRCQALLDLGDERLPAEFMGLIQREKFLCHTAEE